MNWTMTQVIGHNIRTRRDALGMTAAALGEKIGDVFGKPWPRQTVYLMEGGDRAMVAQEVLALSQILDMPLVQLFTPPAEVEGVTAGTITVRADALAVQGGSEDPRIQDLIHSLRAIDKARKQLSLLVNAQMIMVEDAKNALSGKPPVERPQGDSIFDVYHGLLVDEADKYYAEEEENGESK